MSKSTSLHRFFNANFNRFATGYAWSDWLTKPYWILRDRQSCRRLDRILGITGSEHQRQAQRRALLDGIGQHMEGTG